MELIAQKATTIGAKVLYAHCIQYRKEYSLHRILASSSLSVYPYYIQMQEIFMIIVWGGFLALILGQLSHSSKTYTVQKTPFSPDDQIKRIGVYYMCIDDLPL